jgi:hypothetical protein
VIASGNKVKITKPTVKAFSGVLNTIKPSMIASWNAVNLKQPTVKGLLEVFFAIKSTVITSEDTVKHAQPTVIRLLGGWGGGAINAIKPSVIVSWNAVQLT